MKKLMKNKKGFTLMEMLIVVAIIVILVSISIPVFSSQLNSAKEATDAANLRAAKAAALSEYMLNNNDTDTTNDLKTGWYYNDVTGKFQEDAPTAYGESGKNLYVQVTIDESKDEVTVKWVESSK